MGLAARWLLKQVLEATDLLGHSLNLTTVKYALDRRALCHLAPLRMPPKTGPVVNIGAGVGSLGVDINHITRSGPSLLLPALPAMHCVSDPR